MKSKDITKTYNISVNRFRLRGMNLIFVSLIIIAPLIILLEYVTWWWDILIILAILRIVDFFVELEVNWWLKYKLGISFKVKQNGN